MLFDYTLLFRWDTVKQFIMLIYKIENRFTLWRRLERYGCWISD